MRAALVLVALLACTMPALAQKNPPPGPVAPTTPSTPDAPPPVPAASVAVQLADTCLRYARGDADAAQQATAEGWTTDSYEPGDSFIESISASRNIPNVGDANLYGTIETYPKFGLRFCRIDITLNSDAADTGVSTLSDWEGFDGTLKQTGNGTYGSWDKTEESPDRLYLLTAQQDSSIVLQVTVITSEAGN